MRFSRQIKILNSRLDISNINADSRKTFLDRIKSFYNHNYNYIDSVNFNYYSQYLEQIGLQYPEFPKLQQLTDIAHAQDIYEMFVGDDYNLYDLTSTMDSLEKDDSNFYGDSLENDVKLTLPRIIDLLTKMETVPDDVRLHLNKLVSYDLEKLIKFSTSDDLDKNEADNVKNNFITKITQMVQILAIK